MTAPSALRDRPPAGPIVTVLAVGLVCACLAGAGVMVAVLRMLGRWAK